MDTVQIATEIRDLRDQFDRQERAVEGLVHQLALVQDREIPASIADTSHRLVGVLELAADIAATQKKLALEIASHEDRLQLLENMTE